MDLMTILGDPEASYRYNKATDLVRFMYHYWDQNVIITVLDQKRDLNDKHVQDFWKNVMTAYRHKTGERRTPPSPLTIALIIDLVQLVETCRGD